MPARSQTLMTLLCLTMLAGFGCRAEKTDTSQSHLEAGRVELLELKEGDPRPAFFAKLQFKSPGGNREKIQFPKNPEELKKQVTVSEVKSVMQRKARKDFKVIYAYAPSTEAESLEKLDVMLLFDVSGSMAAREGNNTRLEASVDAARELLRNYKSGFRIAIAPFDSHNVKSRIENAPFVGSAEEAEAQLNKLREEFRGRPPGSQNNYNTALYNSASYAVDQLQIRQQNDQSRKYALIVLTDGVDDVKPGDDPQVLNARVSLDQITEKVKRFDGQVFAIGVGAGVDEAALKKMAGDQVNAPRYFPVRTPDALRNVLAKTKESLSDDLSIIFLPPYQNYRDLGSKKDFKVKVQTPGKPYEGIISWRSQSVSGPVIDRKLSDITNITLEEKRVISLPSGGPTQAPPWQEILKLFGKLALLSLILAGFWFFLPRLVWPVPSLPSLPSRGVQKPSVSQPSTARRGASSESTPPASAKPRQRFEETRIHDDRNRR